MTDRPITPYAAFESDVPPRLPTTRPPAGIVPSVNPGSPPMPTGLELRTEPAQDTDSPDPLISLSARVANLSDLLLKPEGLLARRHDEMMRVLVTISTEQLRASEVTRRLAEAIRKMLPDDERRESILTLLPPVMGNGADHG